MLKMWEPNKSNRNN